MRHYEFSNHVVDLDKVCGIGPVFEDEGCYYFLVYLEGFCLLSQSFKTTIEASTVQIKCKKYKIIDFDQCF